MAGLESIALAVDFLEREGKAEAKPSSHLQAEHVSTSANMPIRSGFNSVPRHVSSDSIVVKGYPSPTYSSVNESTVVPASLPSAEAGVTEHLPSEVVSQMVSRLSEDNEFDGPPPPPPSPTEAIEVVSDFDVLCGRGGETNHHRGNIEYRAIVKRFQPLYIQCKRRDKPLIASKIVRIVRHNGGRFLRKEGSTWRDVGNTKAREKTSQALREGAPDLRSPQKGAAKFEQPPQVEQQQPPQSPQVLEIRQHPSGFHGVPVPAYGPTAPHFHARANIVEGRPGDFGSNYGCHPSKKMRLEEYMTPSPAPARLSPPPGFLMPPSHQFMAGQPPHGFMRPGMATSVPAPFINYPATALRLKPSPPPPHSLSSHSFPPTVSADDDESKNLNATANRGIDVEEEAVKETKSYSPKKTRGPRLKLLLRRKQE